MRLNIRDIGGYKHVILEYHQSSKVDLGIYNQLDTLQLVEDLYNAIDVLLGEPVVRYNDAPGGEWE